MSKLDEREVVAAKNLSKKFGNFLAVNNVNFVVNKGECFGLLGPNGAGKTSIVKMICGFSPVTSGTLNIFGLDVSVKARIIKARLGVVPQEDNLDAELNVHENLMVYASFFRMEKKLAEQRAKEIIDFMDLTEKSGEIVGHLSGGMKRRLAIGRALINKPDLIILDEPTTGLDPYARLLVWQRLRRLKESGTTMILTTHYLEEASQLCDRLVIIHQGKIIEEGRPEELIRSHVGREALELGIYSYNWEQLIESCSTLIKASQVLGDELILFTDEGRKLSETINSKAKELGIVIDYHKLRPTNLEDVFLKLTGESLEGKGLGGIDEHWE